ncbi:hypothetical protein [Streptomyces cirratus]|uniref:hypothetical protein n=1 Tax=Streptomyces cirratus TaxID=68187 RepID=UPI00167C50E6|nr:hypothetical protein [Streptomyces cirratus]
MLSENAPEDAGFDVNTADSADCAHATADPTAVPAAAGLFLLAVGGWLLNTARPWHKPGHPLTLGLGWAASLTMLLYGLLLLARSVRTVHGTDAEDA